MQAKRSSSWSGFLNQPIFWGILLSVAYYVTIQLPQFEGSLLHKYTTEHITEYVIVILFFWAASDLALRYSSFAREWSALGKEWLPPRDGAEAPTNADELRARLDEVPASLQETKIARRLRLALTYVSQKRSADGFQDYLHDLSERDAEETHANYGFARFVFAITPLLGLLGTVVHFGAALGGISVDQLTAKLPEMVSRMGTAFNTTCVALSVSMLTKFLQFLVERSEEHIVRAVNERAEGEMLNRFVTTETHLAPFLEAVELAQQATLSAMQGAVEQQVELWSTTIAREQDRWDATDKNRERQLQQLLSSLEFHQSTHENKLLATVDRVTELNDLTRELADMLSGEGRLLDLQTKLTNNLELLHRTNQFDQALHSLTAAIHLLTARRPQLGVTSHAA